MTDFDLPTNYDEDPEALIRRTRAKLKKVPALELEDNQTRRSLTPVFEAMANKTHYKFSAPTTATSILGRQSMSEIMVLNSSQLSSTWCKLPSSVERHMKMQVHMSNTFWRSAAPSPSRE